MLSLLALLLAAVNAAVASMHSYISFVDQSQVIFNKNIISYRGLVDKVDVCDTTKWRAAGKLPLMKSSWSYN